MDLSHITSQSLRRILSLTERKDELVKLVAEIETEIVRTFSPGTAPAAKSTAKKIVSARKTRRRASTRKAKQAAESLAVKPPAPPVKTAAVRKARRKGKKPAPLKAKILSLLEASGPKGIRVKDIAAKLGLPAGNISVWISTTGKKLVTKVKPGIYTVKDTRPTAASPAQSAPAKKTAKAGKKTASSAKQVSKISKSQRKK